MWNTGEWFTSIPPESAPLCQAALRDGACAGYPSAKPLTPFIELRLSPNLRSSDSVQLLDSLCTIGP
jgi:hypothetical protein